MTIYDKIEEKGWIDTYIILYKDDFPSGAWEEYCEILGESRWADEIAIKVADSVAICNDEEEEDEDD